MYIPSEALTADVTDYEFRLLAVLCRLAGPGGLVQTTAAHLCIASGKSSDKTVRRALQGLERAGLIYTQGTKRANGYQGKKVILIQNYRQAEALKDKTVPLLKDKNVPDNSLKDTDYRTSHGYVTNSHPSYLATMPLVPNNHSSKASYKLKESESNGIRKREIQIPLRKTGSGNMGKWEDDGDSLAGFGLVEPKDAPQPAIRKSDPKTRGKRPEHEWTAMDVAAEFSYQVGRKYPLLPGTVSVKQLSGALRKFRTQYGTTPLIELELLRLFMADERNFRDIGDEAPMLYRKFLASFGTKMNQARENLGLLKVTTKIKESPVSGTLKASDGRVFQNTLSGRAQLERHEKRLKEK